ncbi:sterol carrier family protein [Kribbella sp. NPDC051770]|uniref:sterol carrier family protein n=1 Tax=Kribbella sp. NPDC051770 TaxID=3155413 RepID=UPI0034378BAE
MELDAAVRRYLAGEADRSDLKLLVKQLLKLLVAKAPGHAVEVRVPPYGAVQCIEGPRHTRGTPGAVVEMPPDLWIDLALGRIEWPEARDSGRLRASGERTDLSALLPLLES